jgi:hypothetical protein
MPRDTSLCTRATALFERVLDEPLTRTELSAHLARARITVKGIPLALLTLYAELEGVICSGPRRGKHQTYARLADRAPAESSERGSTSQSSDTAAFSERLYRCP